MTVLLFVITALAGGLGAVARYLGDALVRMLVRSRALPWGTILINLTGSFALGFVVGVSAYRLFDPSLAQVLGVGFLGGYTTFSTSSVETVNLLRRRRFGAALVNSAGLVVGAVVLAALGLWAGSAIS